MIMKKFGILILVLILTPVLAGLYGMLHDQLTYTICPEYFTKFKFLQFHIAPALPSRISVALVGWYATWWTGILIGPLLGLTGLIHKDWKTMIKVIGKATLVTLIVTFIMGLLGLAYGKFYLASAGVSWWLPEDLIDRENFIAVGSMHNFSYLGGLLGLIFGIVYQVWQKKKMKRAFHG
jgi:hypothetical protein